MSRPHRLVLLLSVGLLCSAASASGAIDELPHYDRIRQGLQRPPSPLLQPNIIARAAAASHAARQAPSGAKGDPFWDGLLIGAGIGAGGGYVWARNICGRNDRECFFIAAPVGVLVGAGIGAAIGATVDALHK